LPAQVRRSAATCVQPQRDKLSRAGTVEWYFTLAAETPVAMAPGDTGTPIAKVGTIAMPLIGFYPPEWEGAPPPPTTYYEVLLPSGGTGWVPVTAARLEAELVIDRWNRRLATGRDMLSSPTIRASLVADTPWLDVFGPGCGTSRAIDLRTVDRHPLAFGRELMLGWRDFSQSGRRR
jgi:hypothetical protein